MLAVLGVVVRWCCCAAAQATELRLLQMLAVLEVGVGWCLLLRVRHSLLRVWTRPLLPPLLLCVWVLLKV